MTSHVNQKFLRFHSISDYVGYKLKWFFASLSLKFLAMVRIIEDQLMKKLKTDSQGKVKKLIKKELDYESTRTGNKHQRR